MKHDRIYLIKDNLTGTYRGKHQSIGRSGQPAVYWKPGIAQSAMSNVKDETLPDGSPRFSLVCIQLSEEVVF